MSKPVREFPTRSLKKKFAKMLHQVVFTLLIAMVAADSEPSFKQVSKGYGKGVSKGLSGKGFNKGFNGFNKGYNGFNTGNSGFNTGYNGFNTGYMGHNKGMMYPSFGFNGFNRGFNGFNRGYNGFNNGNNGYNNGYNGFNPSYMGFNGYNGFRNGYNGNNGYKKGNMFNSGMYRGFGSPMGNGFNMNRRVYPGYPRFGGNSYSVHRSMGYFGDDDGYKGGYFPGQFRRGPFFQRPSFGGYNSGYRGMSMKRFGGPYQGSNMFRSSYPKMGYKSSMSAKKGSY